MQTVTLCALISGALRYATSVWNFWNVKLKVLLRQLPTPPVWAPGANRGIWLVHSQAFSGYTEKNG